jgi:hypothetical protein
LTEVDEQEKKAYYMCTPEPRKKIAASQPVKENMIGTVNLSR